MLNIPITPAAKRVLHTVLLWAPLWILSTILFGLMGVVYAFVLKEDAWLASQAIMVRDEATGAVMRLGRFESQTQMKAAQETILEMSKNHQVVREALTRLGPDKSIFSFLGPADYPSNIQISDTSAYVISVHAPKGTEFGVSEVIYLDTKQSTPERAVQLNLHLCDALEERLRQVRKSRAESIIAELTLARNSAAAAQRLSTQRLTDIESKAGVDLSDLRGMTDMIASSSSSRTQLDQLKLEIRAAESKQQQTIADLKLMQDAAANPSGFLVTPNELINSQPGLKKLSEGYAESQINASMLSGRFTDRHPLLIAARTGQQTIRARLFDELEALQKSKDQELKLVVANLQKLQDLLAASEQKLSLVADHRADYGNLVEEVKTRTKILENAERELAEASASADASLSTSLISRLDAPTVSDKPIGPGRTTICALCAIAGLVFGLGVVFVLAPNEMGHGFGRRWTDGSNGRRREDGSEETRRVEELYSRPIVRDVAEPTANAQLLKSSSERLERPSSHASFKRPNPSEANEDEVFRQLSKLKDAAEASAVAGTPSKLVGEGTKTERRQLPRPTSDKPTVAASFGLRQPRI